PWSTMCCNCVSTRRHARPPDSYSIQPSALAGCLMWQTASGGRRFRLGGLSGLKCRPVHRHLHVEGGTGFVGTTEAVATFYCEAARTFPSCFRLREPRGPRGRACPPPAQSRLGGTEAVAIQSGYQSAFSLSAAQNRLPSRQSGFLKQP